MRAAAANVLAQRAMPDRWGSGCVHTPSGAEQPSTCVALPLPPCPHACSQLAGTFRVLLLRKRGQLVSAAAVRAFGAKFAEVPFVATRDGYRREGHCRRLMQVSAASA